MKLIQLIFNKTSLVLICVFLSSLTNADSSTSHQNSTNQQPTRQLSYGFVENIRSTNLKAEREIYIKLPESYPNNTLRKYPVLYVLHGQWDMLGAIAAIDVISDNIPELIVVGVQSSGKELRPVTNSKGQHNQQGKDFSQFFTNEVIPRIETGYRTANYRILSGHSNSGRFVLHTLLDHANQFDAYFAFSPSLDDGFINSLIKNEPKAFTHNGKSLVMALANEGEHMQKPYSELVDLMDNRQGQGSKLTQFNHKEFPNLEHSESKLSALGFGLSSLFEGWVPSREIMQRGLSGFNQHNQNMSNKFGFEAHTSTLFMLRMSFVFSRSENIGEHKKLDELVEYILNENPKDISEFLDLINVLKNNGFVEGAIRMKKSVCKKMPNIEICSM